VDTARATYLLAQATTLCQSIVNPLPTGADAVVLDVAARAYTNPANVSSQNVGPYAASYGAVAGGLWLTRQNKSTLRRLNGGSSAFSIDPVDPDARRQATAALPWWGWDASSADAVTAPFGRRSAWCAGPRASRTAGQRHLHRGRHPGHGRRRAAHRREQVQGRDTLVEHLSIYLSAGTAVTHLDAVDVDGQRWEVDGSPTVYLHALTGWKPGVEVGLRRVAG
jgi:hypothetical protein